MFLYTLSLNNYFSWGYVYILRFKSGKRFVNTSNVCNALSRVSESVWRMKIKIVIVFIRRAKSQ